MLVKTEGQITVAFQSPDLSKVLPTPVSIEGVSCSVAVPSTRLRGHAPIKAVSGMNVWVLLGIPTSVELPLKVADGAVKLLPESFTLSFMSCEVHTVLLKLTFHCA